mmetsp:Transcript_137781/g.343907  ORF Transcript_137781/g.343907 Transcript_137781/m.343907 type:complete len:293 (+) Transcript_137781:1837-2715(+)
MPGRTWSGNQQCHQQGPHIWEASRCGSRCLRAAIVLSGEGPPRRPLWLPCHSVDLSKAPLASLSWGSMIGIQQRQRPLPLPSVVEPCVDLHLENCRSVVHLLHDLPAGVAAVQLRRGRHSAVASAVGMAVVRLTVGASLPSYVAMATSMPVISGQWAMRQQHQLPESHLAGLAKARICLRATCETAVKTIAGRSCRCQGLRLRPLRRQVFHHCLQRGQSGSLPQAVREAAFQPRCPASRIDLHLQLLFKYLSVESMNCRQHVPMAGVCSLLSRFEVKVCVCVCVCFLFAASA